MNNSNQLDLSISKRCIGQSKLRTLPYIDANIRILEISFLTQVYLVILLAMGYKVRRRQDPAMIKCSISKHAVRL